MLVVTNSKSVIYLISDLHEYKQDRFDVTGECHLNFTV